MNYTWGGYPRISEDPDDTRLGIGRQTEDITEAVKARGGDPDSMPWYVENDTSAYKKRRIKKVDPLGNEYWGYRVIRPVWHEALHDLRSGKINALMVYDLERLARDPRDLEDAIEAVQYYGARIEGVVPGAVDLSNDSGIAMARVMVAMGNKSSADTGRRVKRAHRATAEAGLPVGGTRPFGWLEDKMTQHPVESELVRQAAQSVISGIPIRAIVRAWKEAGVKTTRGNDFNNRTVRQMLRSPRYAGWRVLNGEVVHKNGELVRGQWDPILDQDTFDRVQLVFDRPDERSRKPRRDSRHYLLTGIMRCGTCNGLMYGNAHRGGKFYYTCDGQRVRSHGSAGSGLAIDRIVSALVLERLAKHELEVPEETWDGQGRLDEIDRLTQEAMAELRTGKVSSRVIWGHVEHLEQERAELERGRTQWLARTSGPASARLTVDDWLSMDVDEQRAHVEKLLEAVVLMPATRRGNTFDPDRLVYVWR